MHFGKSYQKFFNYARFIQCINLTKLNEFKNRNSKLEYSTFNFICLNVFLLDLYLLQSSLVVISCLTHENVLYLYQMCEIQI